MLAGGPILGSMVSVAWSVALFLSVHSYFQVVLGIIWLYMQAGTLLKGKSDGDSIREALQELKPG
jgi:cobalamin biosynthesis protein CobD/CbiB